MNKKFGEYFEKSIDSSRKPGDLEELPDCCDEPARWVRTFVVDDRLSFFSCPLFLSFFFFVSFSLPIRVSTDQAHGTSLLGWSFNIRLVEKSLLFNFANFALFASLSDKYYNYKHSQSARTPSRRSTIKFTSRASISRNVKKRCKKFSFFVARPEIEIPGQRISLYFYCSIVGQARKKKKNFPFFFLPSLYSNSGGWYRSLHNSIGKCSFRQWLTRGKALSLEDWGSVQFRWSFFNSPVIRPIDEWTTKQNERLGRTIRFENGERGTHRLTSYASSFI